MTQIWFYHLQRRDVQESLPDLLEKVIGSGKKAVILGRHPQVMDNLDAALWQDEPGRWLPHGRDFNADLPLLLTLAEDHLPGADILITIDGAETDFSGDYAKGFDRIFDMFDGNDPVALEAARNRWRAAKSSGADLAYWQQTDSGGWQRKQ